MRKITLIALSILGTLSSKAQTAHTIWMRSSPSNAEYRCLVGNATTGMGTVSGYSLIIADWTAGGTPYNWRSLLTFNLPAIPTGAVIDSAYISLWANPTSPSGNPGNPTWGTNNAVGIYRIIDNWDTSTVSWATSPGFSTTHVDTLEQSTSTVENYLHQDVTNLVQDMYSAGGKYSFMFKHIQETTPLNSMIFYSPYQYATDTSVTPLLVVNYTAPSLGVVNVNNSEASLELYPNPAADFVNISISKEKDENLFMEIVDCFGRTMATKRIADNHSLVCTPFNLDGYPRGVYIVKLRSDAGYSITRRLTVN